MLRYDAILTSAATYNIIGDSGSKLLQDVQRILQISPNFLTVTELQVFVPV